MGSLLDSNHTGDQKSTVRSRDLTVNKIQSFYIKSIPSTPKKEEFNGFVEQVLAKPSLASSPKPIYLFNLFIYKLFNHLKRTSHPGDNWSTEGFFCHSCESFMFYVIPRYYIPLNADIQIYFLDNKSTPSALVMNMLYIH